MNACFSEMESWCDSENQTELVSQRSNLRVSPVLCTGLEALGAVRGGSRWKTFFYPLQPHCWNPDNVRTELGH